MKRPLWLLSVPVAAIIVASLASRPSPVQATNAPAPPAPQVTSAPPTWVAATIGPVRRVVPPPATAKSASGPKPMTESRSALLESRIPAVPTLSVDHLDSPRERLLAAMHPHAEARQAQLGQLNDRAAARLATLREERAHATGDERARLDQSIAKLERNQSFRGRALHGTVPSPYRPGAAIGVLTETPASKPEPH